MSPRGDKADDDPRSTPAPAPAPRAPEATIASLGPGRAGGLLECLAEAPTRQYTYVADRLTQVFEFPFDATRALLRADPALRDALLWGLTHTMAADLGLADALRDASGTAVFAKTSGTLFETDAAPDPNDYAGAFLFLGGAGTRRAPACLTWDAGAAPDFADGSLAVLLAAAHVAAVNATEREPPQQCAS